MPPNLVLEHGPMARALDSAAALVTVSSTAALEALARDIQVVAIDDFGVGPEQINEIFVGSNLLASLDDVAHGRFRRVERWWLGEAAMSRSPSARWRCRCIGLSDAPGSN